MRALSDPIRLEVVLRLAAGKCCTVSVTRLAKQIGVSPSNLSYHLSRLSDAGVLGCERDHRVVNYWVVQDHLPLLRALCQGNR